MEQIRKISIGADYKSGAMHYIVNQEIFGGTHMIHLIKKNESNQSLTIFIENKKGEIFLWKEFNSSMPVSIEYNIYFE
jgi:hypothetical protein|tara:strand:- start:1258 stop:1491 length:234 start_codon:yes stop_codon:yes gene_type:complete